DIQLLLGILVLAGLCFTVFLNGKALYNLIWIVWVSIFVIGFFFAYRLARRIPRMTGITSFAGKLIGMVWLAITISIALMMFIVWRSGYTPYLESFIALLVGVGFFVESFVSWREFIIAAILYWAAALIDGFFPDLTNLVFAFLVFATMVLPGIVAKIKFREVKV
ncbi:MAG: hypothetical protein P8Y30_05330, partial [candidate division WOR-3 bacterium]